MKILKGILGIALWLSLVTLGFVWMHHVAEQKLAELRKADAPERSEVESSAQSIAIEAEGVVAQNPTSRHVLSALFLTEGTIQVVFVLPPHADWTQAIREEVVDSIDEAMARGAIQFQIIQIQSSEGTVVIR